MHEHYRGVRVPHDAERAGDHELHVPHAGGVVVVLAVTSNPITLAPSFSRAPSKGRCS
jgi:hypothetical protein